MMYNNSILIAARSDEIFLAPLYDTLSTFHVITIEPAFEGELIRALKQGWYHPAVLIVSSEICDTDICAMMTRIKAVTDASVILTSKTYNIDHDIKAKEGAFFHYLVLPSPKEWMHRIIDKALKAYHRKWTPLRR